MSKSSQEIEQLILGAIDALQDQAKPNIARTAREFGVPVSRLRARVSGRLSRLGYPSGNRKLNQAQEAALCSYIDTLDKLGLSPRRDRIATAANSILKEGHSDKSSPPPTIGEHWIQRFLARHPEYKIRRRRSMDIERKRAHDKTTIEQWFQSYHQALEKYGITPHDLYNFDETGFSIGVGRDQWIITREPRRKIFGSNEMNREHLTAIEAKAQMALFVPQSSSYQQSKFNIAGLIILPMNI
jgi:hypothetical protein